MKDFYVTVEYRLEVKADNELKAKLLSSMLTAEDAIQTFGGAVEIQGCDIVCLTEEGDD